MSKSTYNELHPAPIDATISRLASRIAERFPESGLSRLAAELVRLAQENQRVIEQLRRPLWWLRGLIALAITAVLGIALWAAPQLLRLGTGGPGAMLDLLQGLEAALNELIFLSLALLFLASLEGRLKRRVALRMLHQVRSIAHVVDMHQLTKDPEFVLEPVAPTASSPTRTLTRAQLARYLDYCSELLALMSKLAALHAQHVQDPVLLSAVNEIETLTSNLSRKIWQKIMILDIALPQSETTPDLVA